MWYEWYVYLLPKHSGKPADRDLCFLPGALSVVIIHNVWPRFLSLGVADTGVDRADGGEPSPLAEVDAHLAGAANRYLDALRLERVFLSLRAVGARSSRRDRAIRGNDPVPWHRRRRVGRQVF